MPAKQLPKRWSFLGVLVHELTEPGAPVLLVHANRAFAAHGSTNVGPPMEQAEAAANSTKAGGGPRMGR